MDIEQIEKNISNLVNSFTRRTLFILGSGVSRRYIPDIAKAKPEIKKGIYDIGIYFPVYELKNKSSKLRSSLLTKPSEYAQSDLENLCWSNTSDSMLGNLYLKQILPQKIDYCPEYQIFNCIKERIAIFDFNHDLLSECFISKKIPILYPHGKFPAQAHNFIESFSPIDWQYDLSLLDLWGIHPPYEEQELILNKYPYIWLKNNFGKFETLSIIGYSFCGLQDRYSLDLVIDLAKFYKCSINIVNPNKDQAVEIAEFFLSRYIYPTKLNIMEIKWDLFCRSFFNHIRNNCICSINTVRSLTSRYISLLVYDEEKLREEDNYT